MERVEHLLKLTLASGIGPVTIHRLLRELGSADAVLGESEERLRKVEGVTAAHARAVREAREIDPRPELDAAGREDVELIGYDDPRYPEQLRQTYDPPVILYVRGELVPADGVAMAVVGTRRPTHYGREQAERFGDLLARSGFTVVSGLARGIDTCAHRGALRAGGRTLAVLGNGLGHVYPEENRDLAAQVTSAGALLSEFRMDAGPARENFPRRNRIVAGLALGVLVVEAPSRSGAVITARYASEMNRELFVIPGRIDHENTAGCHRLIREGATLARDLDDILEEFGPLADTLAQRRREGAERADPEAPREGAQAADDVEAQILSALGPDPAHIDHICATTGLAAGKVSAALMILELKRAVVQKPVKFFVRART